MFGVDLLKAGPFGDLEHMLLLPTFWRMLSICLLLCFALGFSSVPLYAGTCLCSPDSYRIAGTNFCIFCMKPGDIYEKNYVELMCKILETSAVYLLLVSEARVSLNGI